MVSYAKVRYSGLGDYVWVLCVYIVNKSGRCLLFQEVFHKLGYKPVV